MPSSVQLTWILQLLLLLPVIKKTNCYFITKNCNDTEFCVCETLNAKAKQYKCKNPDDTSMIWQGFDVHLDETANSINIECPQNHSFSIEKIPCINFCNAVTLTYKFCPLSSDNNFNDILKKFSVNEIKNIEYIGFNESLNYLIKKDFFKNLTSLKSLTLASSYIRSLELDTFDYVPNLTTLKLMKNKIKNLKADQFKNLVDLKLLDLSENQLQNLPNNFFANLNKLKYLLLTKNNLTELNSIGLKNLTKLTMLDLQNTQISNISENVFENMSDLSAIYLSNNPLKKLPNDLFKNNKKLIEIFLKDCQLEQSIPENIFTNSINLKNLKLSSNPLKTLPDSVFKQLSKLEDLDLDEIQLKNISIHLFQTLKNLKTLNLEKNFLKSIDENIFNNLSSLKTLKLSHNQISFIDPLAFSKNLNLVNIEVSHNKYSGDDIEVALLSKNSLLKRVNFSHNKIVHIDSIIVVNQTSSLENLDLSFNNIADIKVFNLQPIGLESANINLTNNNIAHVDFSTHNHPFLNSITIALSNNPLVCDCLNYKFLQFLKLYSVDKKVKIDLENEQICTQPEKFRNISFKNLNLSDISCDISESIQRTQGLSCPSKCNCIIRPYYKSYIINCANGTFTTYPAFEFTPSQELNQVELHLEFNNFTNGPSSIEIEKYYSSVTRLYLSNNYIKNITSIPPNLQLLQLNNNSLERLDDEFLEYLNTSSISNLTLHGNPWVCECNKIENFARYLRNHANQVVAVSSIFCANTEQAINGLNEHSLCTEWQSIALIIAVMSVFVLCASTVAAYYCYQEEIKRWLFINGLCWWCILPKDEVDKIYDVFISYSDKDEDFVQQHFLPVLESGRTAYKACVKFRDWVPGEFNTTQITQSVQDSRRTIIILSSNFVESVWSIHEFRTALTQAITENSTEIKVKVIIMLYGNIDIESLDEELKAYLRTNTYIKWGDSNFWTRLLYALRPTKNSQKSKQKYTNLMHFFDDKFNLIRTSVSSTNTTSPPETPSAITNQPKYLQNQRYSLRILSNSKEDMPNGLSEVFVGIN